VTRVRDALGLAGWLNSRHVPTSQGGRVSGASAVPQTARSPGAAAGASAPGSEVDCCPLCRAPLHPDQQWCLQCGAAARTRLAPAPNWKVPIIAVVVVAGLALAVLAAALVKIAGDSGSPATRAATTSSQPAFVTSPGTATLTPAPSPTTPGATAPSASTPVGVAPVRLAPVTTLSPSIVRLNGVVDSQGVPTTYQFRYGVTASYGGLAPGTPFALGAGGITAVSANLRVTPGTTYHYKLTASKAGRIISTGDATFTTLPAHSPPGAGSPTPGKTGASR
jgi:hypothetical protein